MAMPSPIAQNSAGIGSVTWFWALNTVSTQSTRLGLLIRALTRAAVHGQGIIHRDIKPDNLLLTEDDCLKIVDFGVSEMFEKSTDMRTAKSAGSPAFLPPELCMAKHGDISGKAADIWSMGISLYCLKYGRLPFHRDNVLEMYESIRTEDIPFPSDEDPDLVDLLQRILQKDAEKRITMSEIRVRLVVYWPRARLT